MKYRKYHRNIWQQTKDNWKNLIERISGKLRRRKDDDLDFDLLFDRNHNWMDEELAEETPSYRLDSDHKYRKIEELYNVARNYMFRGDYDAAVCTLLLGLVKYPGEQEVAVAILEYAAQMGNSPIAADAYRQVCKQFDQEIWTEELYCAVLSYMMSLEQNIENRTTIKKILEQFSKTHPHSEQVYLMLSSYAERIGAPEKCKEALEEAVSKLPNASGSCQLRLAEIQIKRGLYEEASANLKCAFICGTLSPTDLAQASFLQVLCEEMLLRKNAEIISEVEAAQIAEKYQNLLNGFSWELDNQAKHKIRARLKTLPASNMTTSLSHPW